MHIKCVIWPYFYLCYVCAEDILNVSLKNRMQNMECGII